MSSETTSPRQYTHSASTPAILLMLKDGMIQKAVLFGSQTTMVYAREEGRGGFSIVPVETATDFLAFDDLLTQEPEVTTAALTIEEADPATDSKSAAILSITVKNK